jgi:hypothetical protein
MTGATTPGIMSPVLLKVTERARREPNGWILSLAQTRDTSTEEPDGGNLLVRIW